MYRVIFEKTDDEMDNDTNNDTLKLDDILSN